MTALTRACGQAHNSFSVWICLTSCWRQAEQVADYLLDDPTTARPNPLVMLEKSPNGHSEAEEYIKSHPETLQLDVIYADLCGLVRGKRYPIRYLDKIMSGGLATPGSVFLLDVMGECHDPCGRGFSDGDPDNIVRPVSGTLKPVPWAKEPTAQVLATFEETDGSPYYFEPRNVLARVLDRLYELKLHPVVAFELEFYLIDRARSADGAPQPPMSPITGERMAGTQVYGMAELDSYSSILSDISEFAQIQGIETGAITKEYAPGQFEINLQHLDDPLRAADECIFFKRIVKKVAQNHGMEATFMAKPYPDTSGSGLHLHCSLLNEAGENVFAEDNYDPKQKVTSDTLKHGIAGILDLMPASMAILAPNVNSFRRFAPNIYVPVSRSWAHENRSVALRIPSGDANARRIEHRVAGADANPYLALATLVAGLHHGLTKQLEPPKMAEGNAGSSYDEDLPMRPRPALDSMEESKVLESYFGGEYIRTYIACKRAELEKFEAIMSPAEFSWFLQSE
ncbi:MAG: glutamine synthetase family protein [Kiloniellales bacterium]|nr:glutamine synthetase family protein [Kiloniellales bacterium]